MAACEVCLYLLVLLGSLRSMTFTFYFSFTLFMYWNGHTGLQEVPVPAAQSQESHYSANKNNTTLCRTDRLKLRKLHCLSEKENKLLFLPWTTRAYLSEGGFLLKSCQRERGEGKKTASIPVERMKTWKMKKRKKEKKKENLEPTLGPIIHLLCSRNVTQWTGGANTFNKIICHSLEGLKQWIGKLSFFHNKPNTEAGSLLLVNHERIF